MSTLKRKLASRANGKKSTGPITEEGQRIASRNALRHGMLAASIVLDGESKDRFLDLLNSLIEELEPADSWESAMVENMAIARWRQMRVWGMEKANLTQEILKQESAALPGEAPKDLPTKAALAFRALSDSSRSLDLFNRYETCFYRMYSRSMDRIEERRSRFEPAAPTKSESNEDENEKSENFQTNLDFGLDLSIHQPTGHLGNVDYEKP
jgi:hypothetical protein